MAIYCTSCGQKFEKSDGFCSKCGTKRVSKKDQALFASAHKSSLLVFAFQLIFFFIYPYIYLHNTLKQLGINSKFVNFCYHLWNLMILSLIAGVFLRYIWITFNSYPKEYSGIYAFSSFLFMTPYVFWFFLTPICYVLASIFAINRINNILPKHDGISRILGIILGPFFVQYKINQFAGSTSSVKNTNKNKVVVSQKKKFSVSYNNLYIVSLTLLMALLIFTASGHKMVAFTWGAFGDVGNIASEAGVDFTGKYYLYTSNPQLTTMDNVANACQNDKDTVLSLGCNVSVNGVHTIYVSDVNEPSLQGIEEYSMVHEMLHTVFAKLSTTEKKQIVDELKAQYPKIEASSDSMIKAAIKPYIGLPEEDFYDELHSIAPIYEFSLSDKLENYYKCYLTDRNIIRSHYRASEGIVDQAEQDLDSWKTAIDKYDKWVENNMPVIEKQANDLQYLAYNGNYYAYNRLVPIYNKNIDLYNSVYATYEKNYNGYSEAYKKYVSIYDALRRNVSYQQAELQTTQNLQKVNER